MILRRLNPLTALIGVFALVVLTTALVPAASAGGTPPSCAVLAADPAITGNPAIKSAASAIVPASGQSVAYCKVQLLYGTNPNQNIHIVVGLPLNSVDGGQAA